MLTLSVLTVWVGLLVLAASRTAIWKAARVPAIDASNNSESRINLTLFRIKIDASVQAIMIWVPYTNTNGQWIASKLLQGFFGAPVESLCEISVTDAVRTARRTAKCSRVHFLIRSVFHTRNGDLHSGLWLFPRR